MHMNRPIEDKQIVQSQSQIAISSFTSVEFGHQVFNLVLVRVDRGCSRCGLGRQGLGWHGG